MIVEPRQQYEYVLTSGSNWKWPEIPGLHNFGGKLLHSACWDDSFDFQDKTVAVIGAGSSAIQIVPQLQPGKRRFPVVSDTIASLCLFTQTAVTKRLTSINRSKTWITPEFAAEFAPEGRTAFFSETQKIKWENNKQEFLNYRKKVESTMNKFFDMQYKDSESQREAFENFSKTMKERLNYREDLIEKIGELNRFVPVNVMLTARKYPILKLAVGESRR